jgi:hypothetical protein
MKFLAKICLGLGLGAAIAGCHSDRPHDVGRQRPPVDSLDDRDRGLQSKDVVSATDTLARDLLALREFRESPHQWTMVVTGIEDRTIDRSFFYNYDIFTERLRTNLATYGQGQLRLIENKARIEDLRSRELDRQRDDFGQGGRPSGPTRTQPDYALYGKAYDMPNRGTNYYLIEFVVTNLRSGEQVWANKYEVKVAR